MERKLRFKTEQEMIRDYGPNWKNNMPSPRWNHDGLMDYLLGMELTLEQEEYMQKPGSLLVRGELMTWRVGKEQVVEGEEKEYTIKPGGLFQNT